MSLLGTRSGSSGVGSPIGELSPLIDEGEHAARLAIIAGVFDVVQREEYGTDGQDEESRAEQAGVDINVAAASNGLLLLIHGRVGSVSAEVCV